MYSTAVTFSNGTTVVLECVPQSSRRDYWDIEWRIERAGCIQARGIWSTAHPRLAHAWHAAKTVTSNLPRI